MGRNRPRLKVHSNRERGRYDGVSSVFSPFAIVAFTDASNLGTSLHTYILTYLFPAGLYTVVHSVLLRASIYMSLCHYFVYSVYIIPPHSSYN